MFSKKYNLKNIWLIHIEIYTCNYMMNISKIAMAKCSHDHFFMATTELK